MIHSNQARQKTKDQVAREAHVLREIEGQRAARRKRATQFAGKDKDGEPARSWVPADLPGPKEKGDARDKVAAARRGETNGPALLPDRSEFGDTRDKVAAALGVGQKAADELADVGRTLHAAAEVRQEVAKAPRKPAAKRHSAKDDQLLRDTRRAAWQRQRGAIQPPIRWRP